MAKRRAEDSPLRDSPSKRCCCCRPRRAVDVRLGSVARTGGVSPPSPPALQGGRSRRRPSYLDDQDEREEEAAPHRKAARRDALKQAADVSTVETCGSSRERRSPASSMKRPREDCACPETVVSEANGKDAEDTNTEDCTYNSFQYWRAPLPELDLSLLEDANDHPQTKDKSKVKDSSADAMET